MNTANLTNNFEILDIEKFNGGINYFNISFDKGGDIDNILVVSEPMLINFIKDRGLNTWIEPLFGDQTEFQSADCYLEDHLSEVIREYLPHTLKKFNLTPSEVFEGSKETFSHA